jgi:hypothetical protein
MDVSPLLVRQIKERDIEFLDGDGKWEFNDTFKEVFNEKMLEVSILQYECHEEIDTGFRRGIFIKTQYTDYQHGKPYNEPISDFHLQNGAHQQDYSQK